MYCRVYDSTVRVCWVVLQGMRSLSQGILGCIAGYAIFLSPNQTPYRDSYFVEKLLGQGADDGVTVNVIFSQFWNLLGVLPATFWALIIPSSKSGNKVGTQVPLH